MSGITFQGRAQRPVKKSQTSHVNQVIVCGDDQVLILDRKKSKGADLDIIWAWRPSVAKGLPESHKKYFLTTDECKPVRGNRLLITASSGGAILVNRKTKETLFYAHVPNAHSAAYLPGDRIVVALSTAPKGNSIQLFDVDQPDKVLFQDSLYSGHGAVWIPERRRLFVLGYDVLRTYSLSDWESDSPMLNKENEWRLPDSGGHDLYAVSKDQFLLSTSNSVWSFDVELGSFTPFGPLEDVKHVKSVNYDSNSGELVYTKGEISWWTHAIYFQNPHDTLRVNNINMYKVRVVREEEK